MKNTNFNDATLSNLKEVLRYLIEAEEKSYEEYIFSNFATLLGEDFDDFGFILNKDFYNNPEIKHIYAIARRLKDNIF